MREKCKQSLSRCDLSHLSRVPPSNMDSYGGAEQSYRNDHDNFFVHNPNWSHNEDEIGNYMLPGDSNHSRHLPPHLHPNFSQSNNTRLPSNHQTSPHDQAKLDKKRERNRIAASKCRQRKLEKIQTLEEQLYRSKKESEEKDRLIKRLQETINFHVQSGCSIDGSNTTDLDVMNENRLKVDLSKSMKIPLQMLPSYSSTTNSRGSPTTSNNPDLNPDSTCLS